MILNFSQKIKGVNTNFVNKIIAGEKIHTIRKKKDGRWFSGRKIEFYINARTKKSKKFMVGECVCTQDFTLIFSYVNNIRLFNCTIDGNRANGDYLITLAKNDGLSLRQLLDFINDNYGDVFYGQIIHWTNYKY